MLFLPGRTGRHQSHSEKLSPRRSGVPLNKVPTSNIPSMEQVPFLVDLQERDESKGNFFLLVVITVGNIFSCCTAQPILKAPTPEK